MPSTLVEFDQSQEILFNDPLNIYPAIWYTILIKHVFYSLYRSKIGSLIILGLSNNKRVL